MPGAMGLCWLLGFSAEIFDQPWPCIFFISMAPAVGFRCGYLLKELYHERTQNPLEYDLDMTLNDVVERWSDLPAKQCSRLRVQGKERLGCHMLFSDEGSFSLTPWIYMFAIGI